MPTAGTEPGRQRRLAVASRCTGQRAERPPLPDGRSSDYRSTGPGAPGCHSSPVQSRQVQVPGVLAQHRVHRRVADAPHNRMRAGTPMLPSSSNSINHPPAEEPPVPPHANFRRTAGVATQSSGPGPTRSYTRWSTRRHRCSALGAYTWMQFSTRRPRKHTRTRPSWLRPAAAKTQFQATQEEVRNFHELHYAAKTWDRRRRVIVKAEHLPEGPNVRFVVTNLTGPPAAQIYDELYVARGDMKNRIKEQQLALFADRASYHAFLANQFRVLLSAAAYVLVETLRRTALPDTELHAAQARTIRLKLFKVAGRVVEDGRESLGRCWRWHCGLLSGLPTTAFASRPVRRLAVSGQRGPLLVTYARR
ncbi:MAG: transposase [Planctomycetota bacterium]